MSLRKPQHKQQTLFGFLRTPTPSKSDQSASKGVFNKGLPTPLSSRDGEITAGQALAATAPNVKASSLLLDSDDRIDSSPLKPPQSSPTPFPSRPSLQTQSTRLRETVSAKREPSETLNAHLNAGRSVNISTELYASSFEQDLSSTELVSPLSSVKRRRVHRRILTDDDDGDTEKTNNDIVKSNEKESSEGSSIDRSDASTENVDSVLERLSYSAKSPNESDAISLANSSSVAQESLTESTRASGKQCSDMQQPENGTRLDRKERSMLKNQKFKEENEKRYSWLQDIKDSAGRRPQDTDYDARTLFIPRNAWNEMKPFEKQYWDIKKDCWDTVLFFQKGKFYELYENDATIGHQLFDLKLTDRVNMRMVGVPEACFEHWASQFVAKGFKVARVDQMETALGKEISDRQVKSQEKVVRRELVQMLTGGTLVNEKMMTTDLSVYCLALKEEQRSLSSLCTIGMCWVDTSTGSMYSCCFDDDAERTKLDTVLAQIQPRELVLEKGHVFPATLKTLKRNASSTTLWNYLLPKIEFWDQQTTDRHFAVAEYYRDRQAPSCLPAILAKSEAACALGALTFYLKHLKLDEDLLSIGKLSIYDPVRKATSMVMNGQTLTNLEIFQNSSDFSQTGTLYELLCRCSTPFGKRLFRQWLCHPLFKTEDINRRLDVVENVKGDIDAIETVCDHLAKLPDLERLIGRIHSLKSKPRDFVRVLEGFQRVALIIDICREQSQWHAELIQDLIAEAPAMKDELREWETAFSWQTAKSSNAISPSDGVVPDFDASKLEIKKTEQRLQEIISGYRKQFHCTSLCYKDVGKEIFQVEVPKSLKSKIPSSWSRLSGTAKVDRYWPIEVKQKVRELQELKELHSQISRELESRFYRRFDEKFDFWQQAIKFAANLDCLLSLAKATRALGTKCCRPQLKEQDVQMCSFRDLYHPCISSVSTSEFITNDIDLGGDKPAMILLTGPNMAGKSTLLRQVCLATIMAQIGCYVPASSATLTPADSIKTRLGARDNIFASQSTFMIEMAETKKILDESTPKSLVILDELGRGTSTHDGAAIAYAVLHHLVTFIRCLGIFSTHYSQLADDFSGHPQIAAKNMMAIIDEEHRQVTFLYKLIDGFCSSSHGMNVAAMAGVPVEIIERAEAVAADFQKMLSDRKSAKTSHFGRVIALCSDFAWMCKVKNTACAEQLSSIDIIASANR